MLPINTTNDGNEPPKSNEKKEKEMEGRERQMNGIALKINASLNSNNFNYDWISNRKIFKKLQNKTTSRHIKEHLN